MFDDEQIERVARAICGQNFLNGGNETDDGWDDCPEPLRQSYRAQARAAIGAFHLQRPSSGSVSGSAAYLERIAKLRSQAPDQQLSEIKRQLEDVFAWMDDLGYTIHPTWSGLVEIADILGVDNGLIPTEGNRLSL